MSRRRDTPRPPPDPSAAHAVLELPGRGYKDGSPPYALRARLEDGMAAIAIHRPANAARATALIQLDRDASAELARFLEERRG